MCLTATVNFQLSLKGSKQSISVQQQRVAGRQWECCGTDGAGGTAGRSINIQSKEMFRTVHDSKHSVSCKYREH